MPTYVYEVIHEDGSTGERFEVVQAMSDPPLTAHPESGEPVRRIFLPPHIGPGKWSERALQKSTADDKKLERLGFTKYVKSSDGKYEKTAGVGPKTLRKDGA